MRAHRVLVVDDEANIRDIVRRYLVAEGFEVDEAADGEQALARCAAAAPDLVVLDVLMPGLDGIEVLRRLRATSDVYVILLTAKAEEVDKLVGLSVGADDYLTKPFSPRELAARVRAVLRRRRDVPATPADQEVLSLDGLVIDVTRREVRRDGSPVELTALEFDLLVMLATAPGRVYTRRQILGRRPQGRHRSRPRPERRVSTAGRLAPARSPVGRRQLVDDRHGVVDQSLV